MTPAQMLKKVAQPERPHTPLVWTPAVRTRPIEVPPGMTHAEVIFMEESATLREGKCPLCGGKLSHTTDANQMVTFRCENNKVFHEWRRTLSFLVND